MLLFCDSENDEVVYKLTCGWIDVLLTTNSEVGEIYCWHNFRTLQSAYRHLTHKTFSLHSLFSFCFSFVLLFVILLLGVLCINQRALNG